MGFLFPFPFLKDSRRIFLSSFPCYWKPPDLPRLPLLLLWFVCGEGRSEEITGGRRMEPEACRSGWKQGLSPTLTESGRVEGLPLTTLTSGLTSRKKATPVSSLDEVMRSHGHSSLFSHHVHHTPGQRSKAYLPDAHLTWPGRMDLCLHHSGHSVLGWKCFWGPQECFNCFWNEIFKKWPFRSKIMF